MSVRTNGPVDPDSSSASAMRASVILAEDDVDLAFVLGEQLMMKGYQVTTAEDGEVAVDMMTIDEPGVLVVDLHLPKRDGHDVAAFARRLRGRDFPIIGISGDRSAMANARARAAGCDLVIPKPFHVDALCYAIERLRARNLPS